MKLDNHFKRYFPATLKKIFYIFLSFSILSSCVPVPSLNSDSTEVGFNAKGPTNNNANPVFIEDFDRDGNDVVLVWTPFTDEINVVNHQVKSYLDSSCSTLALDHGFTGSQLNAASLSGLPQGKIYAKVEALGASGGSTTSECSKDFILVDNTAPIIPTNLLLTSPSTGSISFDDTPIVSGVAVAEEGSKIKLFDTISCGGGLLAQTTIGENGVFNFASINYPNDGSKDGVKVYYAILEDQALNSSTCFNLGLNYTLDTLFPTIKTFVPPLNRGYKEGNLLTFILVLSEPVNVVGGPKLELNVGGFQKFATYSSGTGTTTLIFNYFVDINSDDIDGIVILSPLVTDPANSVKDTAGNDLIGSFTAPDGSNITIDNTLPSVSFVGNPPHGNYALNETIKFSLKFSEIVFVGGTPRVAVDIGGTTKYVNYLSGSGSDTILFFYDLEGGLLDTDGIELGSAIDFNSGAIQDAAGNTVNPSIPLTDTSTVFVDSSLPTISSVIVPTNDTYKVGTAVADINKNSLDIALNFSENVFVSGIPSIQIDIGGQLKLATYVSGTGTSTLNFSYLVEPGLVDSDGIVISFLVLNGGLIKDLQGNDASLAFSSPATPLVKVDSNLSTISSVTPPANGNYNLASALNFTLTFSEVVLITGTPRLVLDIGSVTKYATYTSGSSTSSIVFSYPSVEFGLLDHNGIELGRDFDLNGGTIKDINGNIVIDKIPTVNMSSVLVDTLVPAIRFIIPPANSTYNTQLDFSVNFDEPVVVTGVPSFAITFDGPSVVNAQYVSGTGTSSLLFRYSIVVGDTDIDGILVSSPISLNGGSINDPSGNIAGLTYPIPNTSSVLVDTTDPTITSVTPPAAGANKYLDELLFIVNLSENVLVEGIPQIALDIGGQTKYAKYYSGSGSSSLVFNYVVEKNLLDSNGIVDSSPVQLNGGLIQDLAGNNLVLTYAAPVSVNVNVDSGTPTISSVTPPADGFYTQGQNIDFIVNFSKSVIISNFPKLKLNLDGEVRYAKYFNGSPGTAITFRYVVDSDVNDNNGIQLDSPIVLDFIDGIVDSSGNESESNFSSVNFSGVKVDSGPPTLVSVTPPANASYLNGEILEIKFQFNESVIVVGSPKAFINIGGNIRTADIFDGTGTKTLTFRYIVIPGDNDLNGIEILSPIELGLSTIRDGNLNDSQIVFVEPSTPNVFVDTVAPNVLAITPPANGNKLEGDTLSFSVQFSEIVLVNGTPQFPLNIGGAVRFAEYSSGNGTDTLIFSYNVEADLNDINGIDSESPLRLNSGSIRDVAGNISNLPFPSLVLNYPNIKVDSQNPFISSIGLPLDGFNSLGEDLDFNINLNEVVTVSGNPRIELNIGGETKYANYLSGSPGSILTFRYSVDSGANDNDGIEIRSPFDLNGGTVRDSFLNNLNLTFNPPSGSGIKIDSGPPNIVSLIPPANSWYLFGQNLMFSVIFSESVEVNGTPRLAFDLGGQTKYAEYISGHNSKTLNFRYTVESTDLDEDGISMVSPIELNSGSIKDTNNNFASLNYTSPATPLVQIDSLSPSIIGLNLPLPKYFKNNEDLSFQVNFSEIIVVTGIPRVSLNIGGFSKFANYISGSGTTQLNFSYTVEPGLLDSDGVEITSPIDLNSGQLKDLAGNNSSLIFSNPNTVGINVNSDIPVITGVTPPINSIYGTGINMDFFVSFNKSVEVTGIPRIRIDLDGETKYANFIGGAPGTSLLFRYTVIGSVNDNDGIQLSTPLELNGGTIRDSFANDSSLSFTVPVTSGLLVDTGAPILNSITAPNNGTYRTGDLIQIGTTFSEKVTVVGNPRIAFDLGGNTKYGLYNSGSGSKNLLFNYTVGVNDNDPNGITLISPLDLNTSSIRDTNNQDGAVSFSVPDTSLVLVDSTSPTISSIVQPSNGAYILGQSLNLIVNFSENIIVTGTPRIPINMGGANKFLTYVSGSGTSSLTFTYIIELGLYAPNGISLGTVIDLNAGSILDLGGNTSSLSYSNPNLSGVIVDSDIPSIQNLDLPSNGYYTFSPSQNIDFTINFSELVQVTGTPRIKLNVGGVFKYADHVSGSASSTQVFRYTVDSGANDNNGIRLTQPLELNGGSLKDLNGNDSVLVFPLPNSAGIKVDSGTPSIIGIVPPSNGNYILGQELQFQVNFSEEVIITGTPRISLDIGGVTRYANYLSGTNSKDIIFSYTTVLPDFDSVDGITVISPIDLSGGTIVDGNSNVSSLTFSPLDTTGVLIDTVQPTISPVDAPSDGSYKEGNTLSFIAHFTESVEVGGIPKISLDIGGVNKLASYQSGSGSADLTFSYIVEEGLNDNDGINSSSPILLSGGTLKDTFGNNAVLTFAPPNTTAVLVDSSKPIITNITAPFGGVYINGQDLDFTVTFSESVTITNSPRIVMDIDGNTKYATYQSGSPGTNIVFRYTVEAGINDNNGIQSLSPIELNTTGKILDSFGNPAKLNFDYPNTSNVILDSGPPSITSIVPPGNGLYGVSSNLTFSINFSETIVLINSNLMRLGLDIGGTSKEASYLSGNGTKTMVFSYSLENGLGDLDGISINLPLDLNGGTIKDGAANNASLVGSVPDTSGVWVDTVPPVMSSVTAPANQTYPKDFNLDFTLNFPENVFVIGGPNFSINIGGVFKTASYSSGSGSNSLKFRYTVEQGLNDPDGIQYLQPVNLNGGSIKDGAGNVATIALSSTNLPGVIVESNPPIVIGVVKNDGNYNLGDTLSFTLQFNEAVTVTGAPRVQMEIGGDFRFLDYVSGSTSTNLVFNYIIGSNLTDINGIDLISPIQLNGGDIVDVSGNTIILPYTTPDTKNIFVDSVLPSINTITLPSNGSYNESENLIFDIEFSEDILISGGTPRLGINIGGVTKYANFISSISNSIKRFSYIVEAGLNDNDGITLISPLDIFGGTTIKDTIGNDATLVLPSLVTSGILIDTQAPSVSSIIVPVNNTYKAGDILNFDLTFNEMVNISGNPRLALTLGGQVRYASFSSNLSASQKRFVYVVEPGMNDSDGIELGASLDLNGGTIVDLGNNNSLLPITSPNLSSVKIDTTLPKVIAVGGITIPANGFYGLSSNLNFSFTFDEDLIVSGSPELLLSVGVSSVPVPFVNVTGNRTLNFSISLPSGLLDSNGISLGSISLNGGTINDGAGNAGDLLFTSPNTSSILIDSRSSNITSIQIPNNGLYLPGDVWSFVLTFDEVVNILGIPQLQIDFDGNTKFANYVSGTGSNTLIFRYTVDSGAEDNNGIVLTSPLKLNGGTIRDALLNNANLTFTSPLTSGIKTNAPPEIVSLIPPLNNSYGPSNDLVFVGQFSENVFVTGGTPRISVNIGGSVKFVNYISGSGSSSLHFSYSIESGDNDFDGIQVLSSSLDLNGGTIIDSAGASSDLNFTIPNTVGVFVDSSGPNIISVLAPLPGSYKVGDVINLSLVFNEDIIVSGAPNILINVGGVIKNANYTSGSGTTTLTFSYIVESGTQDGNGIQIGTPINLNGGTLRDGLLNNANLSFLAPNTSSVLVDNNSPSEISINISGGAPLANTTSVTLNLTAVDDSPMEMYITNTPLCTGGGVWESFNSTKSWVLGQVNQVTTVFIKFRDSVLNESLCISDSIVQDSIGPTLTLGNPSLSVTKGASVSFSVIYTDTNTISLNSSYVTLNKTGTADATVITTGSGKNRNIILNTFTGSGTIGINLTAGSGADDAGNLTPAVGPSLTFMVDTEGPTDPGSLLTFSDNFDPDGKTLSVNWTAFSDFNQSTLKYRLDTYLDSSCTIGLNSHGETSSTNPINDNVLITNMQEGIFYGIVSAIDIAGNITSSNCSSDSIIVDLNAPVDLGPTDPQFIDNFDIDGNDLNLSWTAFTDIQIVNHQVFTYTANDCSVGEVNHGLTGNNTTTDSSIVDGLAEGQYWARIQGQDIVGRTTMGGCSEDSIIVDKLAPIENVTNIQFTNQGGQSASAVPITWGAFTDVDLVNHKIEMYSNNSCSSLVTTFNTNSGSNSDNSAISGLAEGTYWAKITAVDIVGRETTSSCSTDFYIVDDTAPTANGSVLSFTPLKVGGGENIPVSWGAFTDALNSSYLTYSFKVYIDDACTNLINTFGPTSGPTPLTSSLITGLASGTYYGIVEATDVGGNKNRSVCSSDSVIVDGVAPQIDNFEEPTQATLLVGSIARINTGEVYTIGVRFNEEVTINGTPKFNFEVLEDGDILPTVKQLVYNPSKTISGLDGGITKTTIFFDYTVVSDDNDATGATILENMLVDTNCLSGDYIQDLSLNCFDGSFDKFTVKNVAFNTNWGGAFYQFKENGIEVNSIDFGSGSILVTKMLDVGNPQTFVGFPTSENIDGTRSTGNITVTLDQGSDTNWSLEQDSFACHGADLETTEVCQITIKFDASTGTVGLHEAKIKFESEFAGSRTIVVTGIVE